MTVAGRVVALWRYPVKSMAPEELDSVEVSWHGLAGDRRWAFIRDGQVRSGFPWLTIRERPELAHYRPRFTEPGRPNVSPTRVRTPSGRARTLSLAAGQPASGQEAGPPPLEAVGQPVVIDGAQALDVIVDVVDV